MIEVRETSTYAKWFAKLADRDAKARIVMRIRRLSLGNFGDAKSIGNGIAELRIDYGPGYRVYFLRRGSALVIVLAGGDKRTQDRDIASAKKLASDWN
jgi:putative addiction module killer protein